MSPRPKKPPERRHNRPLREVLDDLLTHAREIARRAKAMTPAELLRGFEIPLGVALA